MISVSIQQQSLMIMAMTWAKWVVNVVSMISCALITSSICQWLKALIVILFILSSQKLLLFIVHSWFEQLLPHAPRPTGLRSRWLPTTTKFWLCFCLLIQIAEWTADSARPIVPSLFVVTRWQSVYGMLRSLFANKAIIRNMCLSDDPSCQAVHGQDLSDEEWKTLDVCSGMCS